ncbi:MAG: RsmE family RNA methyltransferase [Bacteroidota bacterium]
MQLFYTSHIADNVAILSEEESRHLRVLRKTQDDVLQLTDGKGYLYEGRLQSALTKSSQPIVLDIISSRLQPKNRNYNLQLVIAPTKQNERIEWMLEKAVEVGIDSITFITTDHSEKSRINIGRLEKIVLSAMKQSGEYYLPQINDNQTFQSLLTSGFMQGAYLAHCNNTFEKSPLKTYLSVHKSNDPIKILIGPEGDFSTKEIESAYQSGALGLSLGNTRLRTETAGLLACMACSVLLK